MATEVGRMLVGVFDVRERADRSAAQLLADGHPAGNVQVAAGPGVPPGSAAEWAEGGMGSEVMEYYAGELRAGRWLVTVTCHTDDVGGVLGAFGRNGGSQRVPVEVRTGQC